MNMQLLHNRILAAAGAVTVASALIAAAVVLPARSAQAQDIPGAAAPVAGIARTITVVGEGKVDVKPDVAYLSLGVLITRPSVREASDANQAVIAEVIKAVQAAGVAVEDIQTANYSVSVNNFGPNGMLAEEEMTYQVSNNVNVTVRDLKSVSQILDAAIEAGANNIYGINFALQNSTAAQADARKAAVADAEARAADLASLTGVAVGDIISVSEVVGNNVVAGSFRENAMAVGSNGTPIQPGQLSLTMQLQVVYAIAPAAAQ